MQHPATSKEDSDLIAELHRVSKDKPKLIKSSTYAAPADPNVTIRSWKMDEFKYYDVPSPFPTLARGIFTTEPTVQSQEDKKYRIVIRGYDKFFNIGEVPWTTWEAIERETAAPYSLSLKSNGCIIFIGALSPTQIVITSKHSLGAIQGKAMTHAQAGEKWLRKYMEAKGKTEADLAGVLWKNNWTAIAELCDDSFEEHVLPYPPERTGLHLHGINECTKVFKTLAQADVDAFADEWGFIKTLCTTMDSIKEVRAFMAKAAETGVWQGEAVEGFVVRSHVTQPEIVTSRGKTGKSPYNTGDCFFFKVKFDEPYMMYRDWREVTRTLLKQKEKGVMLPSQVSKAKMKRPETKLYVKWVIKDITENPKLFAHFNEGKGIIAARERFLKWRDTDQGKKELAAESAAPVPVASGPSKIQFGKTIIVPVAIPGCGKTTVAVALAKLFGFGHTQSDDVTAKRAAPVFINNVKNLLNTHDVVIADKNNHLIQHRSSLRELTAGMEPPVRLLALNWTLDKPQATIHQVCNDRIVNRGGNHQSLIADAGKAHEDVLWRFIKQTDELAATEVDEIVEMDLEESIEDALKRAVDACVKILGVQRPTESQIKSALEASYGYKPTKTKKPEPVAEVKKKAGKPPRYYGFLPQVDLEELVSKVYQPNDSTMDVWPAIKGAARVTQRPHITIVHSKNLPGSQDLWNTCLELDESQTHPTFEFVLGNLVWNGRVMAVAVDEVRLVGDNEKAQKLMTGLPEELKKALHITVGTRSSDIPPFEAKDLVERWKKGKTGGVHSLKLDNVVVHGSMRGLFQ